MEIILKIYSEIIFRYLRNTFPKFYLNNNIYKLAMKDISNVIQIYVLDQTILLIFLLGLL